MDEDYSTQKIYISDAGALCADSESESEASDAGRGVEVSDASGSGETVIVIESSSDDDAAEAARHPPAPNGIAVSPQPAGSPGRNPFHLMMAAAKQGFPPAKSRTGPSGRSRGSGVGGMFSQRSGPCPFYKRIPGTTFVVDAFQWKVPDCSHFFLSHFHADHYGGLTRDWASGMIFCSPTTAALVTHELRVPPSRVRALPMYRPTLIEGVTVTLLDANHCPGAAMLLFELPSGARHLHVGDFRWHPRMRAYPALLTPRGAPPATSRNGTASGAGAPVVAPQQPQPPQRPKPLDTLFLDTTYCHPDYEFPPQEAVREWLGKGGMTPVRLHKNITDPGVLFLVGSYKIGKERVFMQLAETLGERVWVSAAKFKTLSLLGWPAATMAKLTTDPTQARIHVVSMGALTLKLLTERLKRLRAAADAGVTAAARVALAGVKRQRSDASAGPRLRAPDTASTALCFAGTRSDLAALGLTPSEQAALLVAQRARDTNAAPPLSIFAASKLKRKGGKRGAAGANDAYAAAMLRQSTDAGSAASGLLPSPLMAAAGSVAAGSVAAGSAAGDAEDADDDDDEGGGFIPINSPAPQPPTVAGIQYNTLQPPLADAVRGGGNSSGLVAAVATAQDVNSALMTARKPAGAHTAFGGWSPFHSIVAIRPTGWAQQGAASYPGQATEVGGAGDTTEVLTLLARLAGSAGGGAASVPSLSRRDGAEDLRPGAVAVAVAAGPGRLQQQSAVGVLPPPAGAFSDAGQLRTLAAQEAASGGKLDVTEQRLPRTETRVVLLESGSSGGGASTLGSAAATEGAARPPGPADPAAPHWQTYKVRLTRQDRLGGARSHVALQEGGGAASAAASARHFKGGGGPASTPLPAGGVTLLSAPYSEHSSFGELRACCQWLRARRIVPTCNCRSREDAERLVGLLTCIDGGGAASEEW